MDNNENEFSTDLTVALENPSETQTMALHPLVEQVVSAWDRSKRNRQQYEHTWARAYYNYRGLYGKEIAFTETEKSRAFVKLTKTKVHAAFAQTCDIVFSGDGFPISVEPTQDPVGVLDKVHYDPTAQAQTQQTLSGILSTPTSVGAAGDNQPLPPGTGLRDVLGGFLAKMFKDVPEEKIKPGPSMTPEQITLRPAEVAAKKMQKKIMDQLTETSAITHLRNCIFECVLLGAGVIKGPFTETREYPKWDDETGMYSPVTNDVPRIEHVTIWDFYPDPEAKCLVECEFVIQRHRLTRTQLRDLNRRPYFLEDAIEEVIASGPNHQDEWWEMEIEDSQVSEGTTRYDVLEYWGMCETKHLKDMKIDIPEEMQGMKDIQVNVFISGGTLLRIVVNPFKPRRIPYQLTPYETNPYNIFGVGLAENMEDSQTLINGFTRLAIDNAILSSNIMLEVDETYLVPGQDMKAYPGKIWRRQGGPPGQAIFSVKWNNVTGEIMQLWDRFRQIADEVTGIPSFSHGQTGVTGTGRTASGMSMLMGAAATNIKSVVKNLDDFLLQPLGEAMFAWNMQFNPDADIKGDLSVKATGTSSVMLKEVKSQRYMQFLQVVSNPSILPLVKIPTLIKAIAETLELDPDDLINDPDEARLQAELLGMANQMSGQGGQQGPGAPPDMSGNGGGNIAPAAPTGPQQSGFTGTPQPSGQASPMSQPPQQGGMPNG